MSVPELARGASGTVSRESALEGRGALAGALGLFAAAVLVLMVLAWGSGVLVVAAMAAGFVVALRRAPEVFLVLYLIAGPLQSTTWVGQVAAVPEVGSYFARLSPLALLGLVAAMGMTLWKHRREPFELPRAVAAFAALTLLLLVGALYSPAPQAGFEKAIVFETVSALGFLAPLVILRDRASFKRFLVVLVAAGTFIALVAVESGHPARPLVLPGSNNEIVVGIQAGLGIVAIVAYLWPVTPGWWRLIWIGPGAVMIQTLVAAGSRGALLGTLVAVVVALVIQLITVPRARSAAVLVIVALAAVAPSVWAASPPDAREKYEQSLTAIAGGGTQVLDAGGGARSEIIAAAVEIFEENPMGVGTNGYPELTGFVWPHNIVLELGAELGWLGIAAFLCLVVATFATLRPYLSRRGASLEAVGALALFLVPFTLAFSSFDINANRYLWLAFGVALAIPRMVGDKPTPSRSRR